MGKINLQRVVVGGLVAGLVLNLFDYAMWGVLYADQMAAAMQALGRPPLGGSAMVWFVILDFLLGTALVWTYAAMRPRFGAGPRTAVYAGLLVWVLVGLFRAIEESQTRLMPQQVLWVYTAVGLVMVPIAAVAGAMLYMEA